MGVKTQLLIRRLHELDEELDLDQFTILPMSGERIHIMYSGADSSGVAALALSNGFSVEASLRGFSFVRGDIKMSFSFTSPESLFKTK